MKLLVIGCGGVATVAIHKCCQNPVFTEICIASRTVSKCDALAEKLRPTTKAVITTATVNADLGNNLVTFDDPLLDYALSYPNGESGTLTATVQKTQATA